MVVATASPPISVGDTTNMEDIMSIDWTTYAAAIERAGCTDRIHDDRIEVEHPTLGVLGSLVVRDRTIVWTATDDVTGRFIRSAAGLTVAIHAELDARATQTVSP